MIYRFEWDPTKAQTNRTKQGVSFTEATQILRDPRAITLYVEAHSIEEDRWVTLGMVGNGAVWLMVHTFEEVSDEVTVIRVISARKATNQEGTMYER
jgi:uncharacterized protein